MHWLREYEGPRGFVYIVGIVGIISPTALAMFLIDPVLFTSMELSKLLLLAASTGGVALVVGSLTGLLLDPEQKPASEKLDVGRSVRVALVMGAGLALAVQLIVLAIVTRQGGSFNEFVRLVLTFTPAMAIALVASESVGRIIESRRAHRARINASAQSIPRAQAEDG